MAKRKYVSEFALSAEAEWVFIVEYENLDRLAETIAGRIPCHIYLICRRPRITIDPARFTIDMEWISGVFRVQNGNAFTDRPFRLRNLMNRADLTLQSEYPYTQFALVTPAGERVSWGKVGLLAHEARGLEGLTDLEVVYVGQAYGDRGSRTAPDRLKTHSTLLSIYAEAANRSPDQEIYLVLLNFKYILISSFDGRDKDTATTEKEDRQHIRDVMSADLSEQMWINFAEAGLIRYFAPEYNTMFKTTFPSPAHESYTECYELDLNLLAIGLDTSNAITRLWSHAVKPSYWHAPHYELHSTDARKSILDI